MAQNKFDMKSSVVVFRWEIILKFIEIWFCDTGKIYVTQLVG